jgi:hypothetical protein
MATPAYYSHENAVRYYSKELYLAQINSSVCTPSAFMQMYYYQMDCSHFAYPQAKFKAYGEAHRQRLAPTSSTKPFYRPKRSTGARSAESSDTSSDKAQTEVSPPKLESTEK